MSQMTLVDVSLHELELELVEPFATSRATISSRSVVVFDVTFDIGGTKVRGVGEAAPMPGWGTESHEASLSALRSIQPGVTLSPNDLSGVEASLASTPTARFAVELAALDAVSKSQSLPLAKYLADGGAAAAEILLNATIGAVDPEVAAGQAVDAVEQGFRCLKLKVGAGELDRDLKTVSRVRDVIGDTISVRLDANGVWDEQHALGALQAFAPYSIEYVEQPVPAEDVEALARLTDASPISIAADESVASLDRAEALIDRAAVDVLVLKPMALGGLLPALRLAERAHEAGLGVTFTSFIDSAIGRTAVAHAAASRPWLRGAHGIATGAMFATDVVAEADPIAEGAFQLDATPGLGREFALS